MKRVLLALLIVFFSITPAFAADELGDLGRRLDAAKDPAERATVQKQIADYQASLNRYDKAADAYLAALPVLRERLTEDEWLQIATYLSWGGKLSEAAAELRLLLQRYPQSAKARVYLARVLLWSGKQDAAQKEVDALLEKRPDDRDALFVKAEILRSRGGDYLDRAIPLYQGLLAREEDFDTRLGLADVYVQKGDYGSAARETAHLKPTYPYQKQELERVNGEIQKAAAARQAEIAAIGEKEDRLKAEGDRLAATERFPEAADRYEQALSTSRGFSVAQRLRMAQVISWAGKLALARRILAEIVLQEPKNLEALVQLARVLTWSGEFDEAIRVCDRVLATDPGSRDARLAKANALRYRGFYRKADGYYQSLLKEAEDFDVRSGYTYGLFAVGRRTDADESMTQLKPQMPYQERERKNLERDRNWAFRPRAYAGAAFYYDNDDNRVATYSAGTQFFIRDWRTSVGYTHARALGEDRATSNDTVQMSTYSRMPWYGGLGGGVGLSNGRFFTWNLRTDLDVLYGSVGASVANEAITDTAETIDKNIRSLAVSAWIVQRPTDRITVTASHAYREYSDSNGSHDTQASIGFMFWRRPAMSIGYRFRYMDFRRQSQGGYFDPDDLQAHSAFLEVGFDARPFYGYMSPYLGYQDYTRNDEHQSGIFGGVGGLLGYWINDRAAFEVYGEWGNSLSGPGTGAGSGWYSWIAGARIIISF